MKYFLDFEANQFSDRIISIGCIAENGNTYSTLVNPKEPIKEFIVNLTGINDELVSNAPNIETAIKELYNFIIKNKDNEPDFFFVYGNCDKDFLRRAAKDINDIKLSMFTELLGHSLIDYAEYVSKFFGVKQPIGLKKVLNYLEDKAEIQKHDALQDAIMLKDLVNKLNDMAPEDFKENPFANKEKEAKEKQLKKKYLEENTHYIMINYDTNKDLEFNSFSQMLNYRYNKLDAKARAKCKKENMGRKIKRAIKKQEKYGGFYYETYCLDLEVNTK